MADDWLTKNRPGAFQHASFGKHDGWFVAITLAMVFATFTSMQAVIPPFSRNSPSVGGGLTSVSAIGVMVYGFWLYGLMGVKRWAIRVLPAVAWILLLAGVLVLVIPAFLNPPILLEDPPLINLFSRIAGLVSAVLSAVALWLMRGALFREYYAQAWAR